MKATIANIDKNWSFTQLTGDQGTKKGEWVPCKQFPTSVHVELIQNGVVPDPVRRSGHFSSDDQLTHTTYAISSWACTSGTFNVRYLQSPCLQHFGLISSSSIQLTTGIGEAEWQFKTSFSLDVATLSAPNVDLTFDGLDTYCTVELVSLFNPSLMRIHRLVVLMQSL